MSTSEDFKTETDVTITRKEAPRAPENQLGTYHLKRWSWYGKQTAISRGTQIIDVKKGTGQLMIQDFYSESLSFMIVSVPESLKKIWESYETRIAFIKNELDADVGDKLRDGCMDITGLDKRSFLPPSEQEKAIPG